MSVVIPDILGYACFQWYFSVLKLCHFWYNTTVGLLEKVQRSRSGTFALPIFRAFQGLGGFINGKRMNGKIKL
jgi:hypothetical protein